MDSKLKVAEYGNKVKQEVSVKITTAEYMLWVDQLIPYSIYANQLTFITPSENAAKNLLMNYAEIFSNAARSIHLPVDDFIFLTKSQIEELEGKKVELKSEENAINDKKNPFVAKYTFDNFVIADNNRFASHTAQAVAINPGSDAMSDILTPNPLYIYGGVGLGKTHLLHAIGNYLFENSPSLNVVYTTAEKISNDYFTSLNHSSTDKDAYRNFRRKYEKCDVLMVDDMQFMQKKGGLQEVFFHIFNELYINGKQIVLSSDRPPKEINDIEERLRSRFESGIMANISEPSLDTRINIINKKLSSSRNSLSDDVVYFIAEKVNTNIRELEGALTKVIMYCNLTHKTPTIDVVKEVLSDKDKEQTETIDSDKIINKVSEYYRISYSDIIGKKKTKDIAEARQIAIYLVCDMLNLPLVSIGQIFGGRDHTTIMYSRDKISSLIAQGGLIKKTIEDIKSSI